MAAAPCPMSVKEAVVGHFGPALYEFYGSTELGVNTILKPADVLRKPGSCGQASPGRCCVPNTRSSTGRCTAKFLSIGAAA